MDLPKGCFFFKDYKHILAKDIDMNRIEIHGSCERAIRHSARIKAIWKFFTPPWKKPDYYRVRSTTCYEMAGRIWRWSETDYTGLEWLFHTYEDANAFVNKEWGVA